MSRIVHLGLGNFFRAHACWWTGAVQIADRESWTISAFTGRRPDAAAALAAQSGRYTLVERGPDEDRFELVTALSEAADGADLARLTRRIADPQTAIITLTITENGYCLSPSGGLDGDHPDVVHDRAELRHPDPKPVTAAGRLAHALEIRRLADAGPLAIVPCDNLASNADCLKRSLLDLVSPALADWIETEASFVNTSVDRITPRTLDADREAVRAATGFDDRAPVITEPFRYWVLAGDFPAGRPSWDRLDARFVDDVGPWERRKLWLLNGAHSLLAYRGLALGRTTVADAMAALEGAVEAWWDEVAPLLATDGDAAYRRALRQRFENPRIAHRLDQIAADGIAKLRVRTAEPALMLRRAGRDAPAAAAVIAAWIDFCATDAGHAPGISPGLSADAASADYLAVLSPALADDRDFAAAVTDFRTGTR